MRSSRKLERPASFADAKPLQESERLFLETIAADAFEQFLSSAMERSPVWSLLGDFNHVTVYEGPALPSEDRIVPYRGSLSLNGSLDEVRAMLSNLTADQMAFTQEHHNDGMLDMAILHHVLEPSLRDPFRHVVVRWFVLECPKPLYHRDFCVLETQKEWLLPGGRRAWAIAQHSVTLPTCPDLKSNLMVVRGSMYNSGLVFLESDVPGVLNVHSHMEVNLKGAMPSWLYKSILKRHVARIGYIASTIHEFRLAECVQSYFVVMVPLRERTHCTQCLKRFHTLRRKWNCRTCGEVFCYKCTSSFEPKGHKTKRDQRVCSFCAKFIREQSTSSIRKNVFSDLCLHMSPGYQGLSPTYDDESSMPHRQRKLRLSQDDMRRLMKATDSDPCMRSY
ncbi:hypothetical protein SDRG_08496 [Saprolegnia diclina VS20]|uniref:FYVE-type domain-containing protein n=1 Tax=Saprolegnia diclina (strain VS20) TaxID=1156394 RepID=T0RN82_SAPDV|nr:hypothetical protein SDRG_08496 [Saprolegnia diclina VS20]EQC33813.1 hypothetical protein SDRG_08496 [Saprolegnia diclina VS20]|eukprot:XP_008612608.1 hypothetical protein SDRG_08496 [Saprolegnia diclina VS20]